jgi:protein O-GlcNAc transferase
MSATKINRNDPCACGSGKKYKRCCLSSAESLNVESRAIDFGVDEAIETATLHHNAGRLLQAENIYKQVLQAAPDHPDALHFLGVIAYQKGEHQIAIELITRALGLAPSASMYGNLGLAIHAQGNLDEAIACFRQALLLEPDHASTYNNLGNTFKSQGKLAVAAECYLQALSLKPDYAAAYSNLGATLHDQGHLNEAVECYRAALSIDPQYAMAHNNLGNTFREQGNYAEAIECFQGSLSLDPGYAMGYNNLGNAFRDQGKPDAAIENYRKALSLRPDLAEVHSNLLLTMHSVSSYSHAELFAEHKQFATQFEAPVKPLWRPHQNSRDKNRRLKIGYVSGDFRDHPIANFFEPVLVGHDKSQVEVYCYHNHYEHDHVSTRIAASSDHWIPCKGLSDESLAKRIRNDGIDILVDLSGHTAHNRLLVFARKPAPIQLTWIGYQSTTGLTAMDYRLTDASLDPVGMTEQFHSETLLRVPACAPFHPAAESPPVNQLPALANDYFTLACLNQLTKITEEAIALWARILIALPKAKLMFGNVNDLPTKARLIDRFTNQGVAEDRLIMHPRLPMIDYLTLHHQIDLALDTFPYNGGTTSLHSLWMGVPLITLAGHTSISRVGVSLMAGLGVPEFCALSTDEYLERTIEAAQNLPKLNQIRQSLRDRMTATLASDPASAARPLEEMFRTTWSKWCDTHA